MINEALTSYGLFLCTQAPHKRARYGSQAATHSDSDHPDNASMKANNSSILFSIPISMCAQDLQYVRHSPIQTVAATKARHAVMRTHGCHDTSTIQHFQQLCSPATRVCHSVIASSDSLRMHYVARDVQWRSVCRSADVSRTTSLTAK